ncbi:MAG: cation-translocating P-type ATPase [Streptococcaceae bacterium]|jgi:calcium-translocating P-type ATPase|nr:cation-translocating P-type ATPase [Streptococcaceae bacterium]
MTEYYKKELSAIQVEYNSDFKDGLSTQQVEKNRQAYGKNIFNEKKEKNILQKALKHLLEIMNIILLIVMIPAIYLSYVNQDGFIKPIVILLIVIINVAVATYQEGRAETALAALKKMSSPSSTVLRNGKLVVISSEDLVCGDIIKLTAGMAVGADIRLLTGNSLQTDEASLTGESEPVSKDTDLTFEDDLPLGDQKNMIFSGTNILNGTGQGIVVATGMNSQMGQIASLLEEQVKGKTPLQKRIDSLAKRLALIAFAAGGLIFIINALNDSLPLLENMMIAVILGIAAVPETLPVIVTLSLIYGVENMAQKRAIVRNIPAVETLGNASVIASDKTGTLTQNQMEIQRIWKIGTPPEDIKADTQLSDEGDKLLALFGNVLQAKAEQHNHNWEIHGDPTEAAIIRLMIDNQIYNPETLPDIVYELPFDSTRKKMTTVRKYNDGKLLVTTKGAFDKIIHSVKNPSDECEEAEKVHDAFASVALRVLAVSFKTISELPEDLTSLEEGQTFYGIVGMIDPPRVESKDAVADARAAGIKPIMITGDHALTAKAIAQELDIYRDGDLVIDGLTLDKMSDDELSDKIEQISVYARVSPEDKLRIVKLWQAKGQIVAMTGDGVNDAPSLRVADVGTAMGIAGTEVAKGASDIILADDNFATIVAAIREGRRVYANIKKTIYYLLSANVAEILVMLIGAIIGWGLPFTGLQLLYINVLADGIPGFGLSRECADSHIMQQAPIAVKESLFSRGVWQRIVTSSTTFIIITLIGYAVGRFANIGAINPNHQLGQTMAFFVLTLASTFHIFNAKSNESLAKSGLHKNKMIFWTTLLSLTITVFFMTVPALMNILQIVYLTPYHWLIAIGLAMTIFVVIEIEKFIMRKRGKKFIG